jgi:lipopolysaccharide assembly protein B
MLELLFLLLPIAAYYGWYMGYKKALRNLSTESSITHNALLALPLDEALLIGQYWRQQGRIEQAIALHQQWRQQPSLTSADSQKLLYELGQDYLAFGMYDRVEELMRQAIATHPPFTRGCQLLFQSFQASKQWQQGIQTYAELPREQQEGLSATIAHFLCERYLETKDKVLLDRALTAEPRCSRARHLRLPHMDSPVADIDYILQQNIDYFPELLPFLKQQVEPHQLTQYQAWLKQALQQQPQPQVLLALIQSYLEYDQEADLAATLKLEISSTSLTYQCHQCGLTQPSQAWFCEGCQLWDTYHRSMPVTTASITAHH